MINLEKHKELIIRRNVLEEQFWNDGVYLADAWDDLAAEFMEHDFPNGARHCINRRDYFGQIVAAKGLFN